MFSWTRSLKLGYILALGTVVLLLCKPQPAPAQRLPISMLIMREPGPMMAMQSMQQARMMLMMAGTTGGMMGGMRGGMMGMGGMMMGGMGMMAWAE